MKGLSLNDWQILLSFITQSFLNRSSKCYSLGSSNEYGHHANSNQLLSFYS